MTKYNITLADGQSNMKGAGEMPPSQPYNANCLRCYGLNLFKVAQEPACLGSKNFGASTSFLQTLYTLNNKPNAIINVAIGGTRIRVHQKGTWMYKRMLSFAQSQKIGTINSFIFSQGERDASMGTDANVWDELFLQLVHDVRTDLGLPNLPVVFTQLGSDPGKTHPYWNIVKESQIRASRHLTNGYMIRTGDLEKLPDHIHYTNPSYITLGQRFAYQVNNLLGA